MAESARQDGKGHWPKGKRRNVDTGDWQTVRLGIQALLDHHAEPGVISLGAIAEAVSADKKTVSKWIKGINRPDERDQDVLRAWLQERRRVIEARRKRQ